MSKTLYLQLYDSLPEEAKQAMSDLLEIGKDDSGIWVRFRDVEATVGKIVLALQKKDALSSVGDLHSGANRDQG